ncbi:YtxH domain-containing protein [Rubrobacter aplysinae]|uniref:YtxH domain-containing protein n=1 Tax=Rubrobacter aplysinae TaxID=909625 RepID=UPI00064B9CCA|nr:YtxH domain-containing protein [Rubrobacter aplysinae]
MDRQKIEKLEKLGTFVLGGIAGTVAGIMISPRSGRELRGAMSSRAGEARERGREGYFEARERARERLSGLRESGPHDEAEVSLGDLGDLGEPEQPEADGVAPEQAPGRAPDEPAAHLRAVPPDEEPETSGEDSEDLKFRIRQTRERLRRRGPGSGDG